MSDDIVETKKAHRPRQSGVKAEKKKLKATKAVGTKADNGDAVKQRNPKAFAINSIVRAERNFRRKEDLTAKKQHIPLVDQTSNDPPPVLVAIVGPPKVGKSTLIRNVIRNFSRNNVTDIKGPITIVISKKRRITLIECNNDINSMIDIAKCADLVLLLCDASFGFEMEMFEFLNICQTHGMPKIMGVLTHLDMIKNPKQLKKRKKELKHRFWTEVYNGAKLFYLSGILHGDYLRNEVKNLCRFISVMKFRPLTWRGTHSYVLVDRVEDVTNTELIRQNAKCERNVILYGYVRGAPMKQELMVHIPGYGDARIDELDSIADPCPPPGTEKKRNLLEKERLLYAPMSGVGSIVYDKDAVYIELQGSHSHKEHKQDDTQKMELVEKLIEKKQTVDAQIKEQEFRLFSDGEVIKSKNFIDGQFETNDMKEEGNQEHHDSDNNIDNDDDDDDDEGEEEDCDELEIADDSDEDVEISQNEDDNAIDEEDEHSATSSDESYQNEDDFLNETNDVEEDGALEVNGGDDEVITNNLSWKENLSQKARDSFIERYSESKNLMRLVYGGYAPREQMKLSEEGVETEEFGGLFTVVTNNQTEIQKEKAIRDEEENCFFKDFEDSTRNWLSDSNKEMIKNCFVTGKWKATEDAENLLHLDDMDESDGEMYGDFEDYETGEKHAAIDDKVTKTATANDNNDDASGSRKRKMTRVDEKNLSRSEMLEKKMKLKAKFDAEYDNKDDSSHRITGDHGYYEGLKAEAQKQSELNKMEFASLDEKLRVTIEGYRAGLYVRISLKDVAAELIQHFDPTYPLLVGSLNMCEENVGFVNCKVKKHRWYKKILKSGDPLIISMGWRRFQTVPIFAKVEDNMRHRYLKYTPNHVSCGMTFWGPITPQNTGFFALQSVAHDMEEMRRLGFRIAATGCVTELDKSTQIVKKLKLVGEPFKIYKKSAFIKGMFNSVLEVAKFEGAKVKTVSGVRGQIKKAHHTPEGSFRATFEDRILLSDIVFCRTWFRVDLERFYAPVTSLLLPPEQKAQWQGMKTLGQLKRERNVKNAAQSDSMYVEIRRTPKLFRPLIIPRALQRALPYKDKPKIRSKEMVNKDSIAIIQSPHEQKVSKMIKMIETNYKHKRHRAQLETRQRLNEFHQRKKLDEMRKQRKLKVAKKRVSRATSKLRAKQQKTN